MADNVVFLEGLRLLQIFINEYEKNGEKVQYFFGYFFQTSFYSPAKNGEPRFYTVEMQQEDVKLFNKYEGEGKPLIDLLAVHSSWKGGSKGGRSWDGGERFSFKALLSETQNLSAAANGGKA